MYKEFIGKKSKKIKNRIERGLVKRFAEAIGDPHPIYIFEDYGIRSRYGQNIAPSTFPRVLEYGDIEGMQLPSKGLIHGEQIYHYERPLLVGEEVFCYTEIKDYVEKAGKSGLMGLLTIKRYGEDELENIIFIEEQTIIITEAVRKAMMV